MKVLGNNNTRAQGSTSMLVQDTKSPLLIVAMVYVVCYAIRMFELLVLRTDQGLFGEAFIHKSVGIVILVLVTQLIGLRLRDIGFEPSKAPKGILLGLGLGLGVFALAYAVEFGILKMQNADPVLRFFVSTYAIDGNIEGVTTLSTVALCILFNVLNVVMEEGLFRGLFMKLLETRYSFLAANVIASLLFGIWHVALPYRAYMDGSISLEGACITVALLSLASFLMGTQLGLISKMSGALWAAMGMHFVNNTIINLLHITTPSGIDAMQSMRISIAQAVSFLIVLLIYWHGKRKDVAVS